MLLTLNIFVGKKLKNTIVSPNVVSIADLWNQFKKIAALRNAPSAIMAKDRPFPRQDYAGRTCLRAIVALNPVLKNIIASTQSSDQNGTPGDRFVSRNS